VRALVFEPNHGGHRLTYAGALARALVAFGVACELVLDGAARGTAEFHAQVEPLGSDVRIHEIPPVRAAGVYGSGGGRLARLLDAARLLRPDYLFVPYADGLTQLLAFVPGAARYLASQVGASEALMMRGPSPLQSLPRRWAARRVIAHPPWSTLHHSDARLVFEIGTNERLVGVMPEPIAAAEVRDARQAREALGWPPDHRFVLVAGYLDERKCVGEIVAAFSSAFAGRAGISLVLAGRMAPAIRAEVEPLLARLDRDGQLVWLDRYVSDRELTLALHAADLVCTVYRAHEGPASIANRAVVAGRYVLAGPGAWFDWTIRRLGLGMTCPSLDPADLRAALREAIERAAGFVPGEVSRRFARFNSLENFEATWLQRVAHVAGRTPPPVVTWDAIEEAAGG